MKIDFGGNIGVKWESNSVALNRDNFKCSGVAPQSTLTSPVEDFPYDGALKGDDSYQQALNGPDKGSVGNAAASCQFLLGIVTIGVTAETPRRESQESTVTEVSDHWHKGENEASLMDVSQESKKKTFEVSPIVWADMGVNLLTSHLDIHNVYNLDKGSPFSIVQLFGKVGFGTTTSSTTDTVQQGVVKEPGGGGHGYNIRYSVPMDRVTWSSTNTIQSSTTTPVMPAKVGIQIKFPSVLAGQIQAGYQWIVSGSDDVDKAGRFFANIGVTFGTF